MPRRNPDRHDVSISEEWYRSLSPARILDLLPLHPEMTVADIGCGSGFFTLPLAERLSRGQLRAVDLEPTMLDMVRARATEAGLTNITMHRATPGAVPLPAGSLDGVFMALTFRCLPAAERATYLARLRPLVRPGGWLAILEWERRQDPGDGPPLATRVSLEETSSALAAAGWRAIVRASPSEWLYFVLAGQRGAGAPAAP